MSDRRAWLPAYLSLAFIWGCSFLLNEIALRAFGPTQVAFGRLAFGALTLAVVVLLQRSRVRLAQPFWLPMLGVALVLSAVPFVLIAFAQTRLTSILAGLMNATTPLWAVLFVAVLVPTARATRGQVLGVLTGFLGIAVLLGVWDVGGIDLVGAAAMLAATACYGFGTVLMQRFLAPSGLPGTTLSFLQLTLASLFLLPLAPVGGAPDGPVLASVLAMVGLGALGSGLAYVLFWRVIRSAGATIGATVTYLVPLVSTTLGVLVLGEPLTWYQLAGGAIVLSGVAITQTAVRDRRGGTPTGPPPGSALPASDPAAGPPPSTAEPPR